MQKTHLFRLALCVCALGYLAPNSVQAATDLPTANQAPSDPHDVSGLGGLPPKAAALSMDMVHFTSFDGGKLGLSRGGNSLSIGWFGQNAERILGVTPQASREAASFRAYRTAGLLVRALGWAALIGNIAYVSAQADNGWKDHPKATGLVTEIAASTALAAFVGGSFLQDAANRHLGRAVDLVNEQALSRHYTKAGISLQALPAGGVGAVARLAL